MIAVAVASIALVTFISLVITSMNMEDHARKMTEATLIANEKLKEIGETGCPENGTTEGIIEDEKHLGFTYRLTVSEWLIPEVSQLELEILWDKGKRSLSMIRLMRKQTEGTSTTNRPQQTTGD